MIFLDNVIYIYTVIPALVIRIERNNSLIVVKFHFKVDSVASFTQMHLSFTNPMLSAVHAAVYCALGSILPIALSIVVNQLMNMRAG